MQNQARTRKLGHIASSIRNIVAFASKKQLVFDEAHEGAEHPMVETQTPIMDAHDV